MSATAEELASQAEQLQAAIAFFKVADSSAPVRKATSAAQKSQGKKSKPAKSHAKGGFDFEISGTEDDLDAEFLKAEPGRKGRAA